MMRHILAAGIKSPRPYGAGAIRSINFVGLFLSIRFVKRFLKNIFRRRAGPLFRAGPR
jgi:hypothetical protein